MPTPSITTASKPKKIVPISWDRETAAGLPSQAMIGRIRNSILESQGKEESSARYRVRDILAKYLPAFLKKHIKELTPEKVKILRVMSQCGSGDLGYTVSFCPDCEEFSFVPRSCGNSNCPSCGALRRQKWIEERKSEVISDMSYYHLTFTLPHQLTPLIYNNQKLLLDLLFDSAQEALLDLCLERHNIVPGIIMVLHTFGSSITLHYHLHVLISAGGLAPDKESFKWLRKFFLPVQKISGSYRENFMTALKRYYRKGRLCFNGEAASCQDPQKFKELCDACYKYLWNVNLKEYGSYDNEKRKKDKSLPKVETVIEYFGRYVYRTAIAPSRIKKVSDSEVTFEYKDYHTDGTYQKKDMTVTPDEFIRRLSLHILPKGFHKIRMAGYLSGNVRKARLKRIHEIIQDEYKPCCFSGMKGREVMKLLFGVDPTLCPKCEKPMTTIGFNTDRLAVFITKFGEVEGKRFVELERHPRGPDKKLIFDQIYF